MWERVTKYSEISYSQSADVCTLIIGIIILIVLKSTYTSKDRRTLLAKEALLLVLMSTIINIAYIHFIDKFLVYSNKSVIRAIILVWYHLRYILNSVVMLMYLEYIELMAHLKQEDKVFNYKSIYTSIFIIYMTLSVVLTHFKVGVYVENGILYENMIEQPFLWYYIIIIWLIAFISFKHKSRIIRRVFNAILLSTIIALVTMLVPIYYGISSYRNITFIIPILVVIFFVHSSPYDMDNGSSPLNILHLEVNEMIAKRENFIFSYFKLDISESIEHTKDTSDLCKDLIEYPESITKNTRLYKVSSTEMILIAKCNKKKNLAEIEEGLKSAFLESYKRHKVPFKLLYINLEETGFEDIENADTLIYMSKAKRKNMELNSYAKMNRQDVQEYKEYSYIRKILTDIQESNNLDDERVVVYYQPIKNLNNNKIKCAEALVRLKIGNKIIYPDKFIGIAEEMKVITFITKCVAHKVCKDIYEVNKTKQIDRISINLSTIDFKCKGISTFIIQEIFTNEISPLQLGIEITESQSHDNFVDIVRALHEFKKFGMKVYLDDYGTGYSNLVRLIKLPFDIIKVDKELISIMHDSSIEGERLRGIINNFKNTGYTLLFEGVETEADEEMCRQNGFSYTQGYLYSKPVPLEEFKELLLDLD